MSMDELTRLQNDLYFNKEVVNRVLFLRENPQFIKQAVTHNSTRFLFFERSNPLINNAWDDKLVLATNGDGILSNKLRTGLKNLPSWTKVIETWSNHNETLEVGSRDNDLPTIVFLGLEDESVGLDLSNVDHLTFQDKYKGIPYFAVDLTKSTQLTKELLEAITKETNQDIKNLIFTTARKDFLEFTATESALFSHGKMFVDWLNRNRFCPGCGSKVIPIHGGGRLHCTNNKVREQRGDVTKYECPVKNVFVSNVSFPRTDAVIITAITNTDRTKMLLSLNKRFRMYSCTSGFMEPSETVEVATKREIWEETGVVCSKINIVMTQPWPFPANLMIGCIAEVEFNGENEKIYLGHDNELEDAKWFDMDFIEKLVYGFSDDDPAPKDVVIPEGATIAHQLIKMVVDQAHKSKL